MPLGLKCGRSLQRRLVEFMRFRVPSVFERGLFDVSGRARCLVDDGVLSAVEARIGRGVAEGDARLVGAPHDHSVHGAVLMASREAAVALGLGLAVEVAAAHRKIVLLHDLLGPLAAGAGARLVVTALCGYRRCAGAVRLRMLVLPLAMDRAVALAVGRGVVNGRVMQVRDALALDRSGRAETVRVQRFVGVGSQVGLAMEHRIRNVLG